MVCGRLSHGEISTNMKNRLEREGHTFAKAKNLQNINSCEHSFAVRHGFYEH